MATKSNNNNKKRIRHETTEWFKIGKEICQSCVLSSCLSNFYAEYATQNARLDEAQAGTKIAGRNIRYADDTTFMAETERSQEPFDEGETGE